MYSSGIGRTVALFYEAWAGQLEDCGNFKKSDSVLQQGIKKGAQPIQKLHRLLRWSIVFDATLTII